MNWLISHALSWPFLMIHTNFSPRRVSFSMESKSSLGSAMGDRGGTVGTTTGYIVRGGTVMSGGVQGMVCDEGWELRCRHGKESASRHDISPWRPLPSDGGAVHPRQEARPARATIPRRFG